MTVIMMARKAKKLPRTPNKAKEPHLSKGEVRGACASLPQAMC